MCNYIVEFPRNGFNLFQPRIIILPNEQRTLTVFEDGKSLGFHGVYGGVMQG